MEIKNCIDEKAKDAKARREKKKGGGGNRSGAGKKRKKPGLVLLLGSGVGAVVRSGGEGS